MVVVLHRRLEVIARHFGRGVVVRASGYWLRLGGLPPTNNASTITVRLPSGNMLTQDQVPLLFPAEGGVQSERG